MREHTDPVRVERCGVVEYEQAWQRQRDLATARVAGGPDTVLLLEHPPVYTAGKRTRPTDRPDDGTPVVDVDRGGRITWHGPGQLVGYPIVKLAHPIDLVAYIRLLEHVLVSACADLGLNTIRVSGRSGAWLPADGTRPDRKVAAIGVRVAKDVTMHGFALNCDPDLTWFDRIVPCGITDAGVTSLSVELGRRVTVADVIDVVDDRLRQGLDGTLDTPVPIEHTPSPPPAAGVDWRLDPQLAGSATR
ncbi:MAG TPA: lipoyl(octanoyl) transferase LipB [Nakamurella sp.]|jgi:lipoyl(octanoyl) transferase